MNYLLGENRLHQPNFIAPILALLAKAVPIVGGVAAGLSAYQQIRESPGGFRVQPPMKALGPGSALSFPRTRTELERVQGFTQAITPGIQDGQYYFRRRRMNVLNPRALSRAIRRVKGFSKFAKRVGSYTDPGRSYKLKGFRKRSRRR